MDLTISPETQQKLIAVLIIISILIAANMLYKQWFRRLSWHRRFAVMGARFDFYLNFIPTRNTFTNIYKRVSDLSIYNYLEIRYQSVAFFEGALKPAAFVFVVALFGFGDLLSATLAFLYAIIAVTADVNKSLDKINAEEVNQISVLIGRMRENYTRTRSVSASVSEVKIPTIIERQVNQIYKMLTTVDGDKQLSAFCEHTPNRIMRTLATTCYLRNDSGDDNSGIGATFNDALALIKDEVDAERIRLFQQRVMFSTIERLPMIPLVMYPVIVAAYGKIIPATKGVFDSFWGYLIKIAILLVSLICFYLLTTINNSSIASVDDRIHAYVDLLRRPEVMAFAKTLVPKNYKKWRELKDKLAHCLSSKSMEYFYFEKFMNMCIFFVASIIMSIFITQMSKQSVYNSTQAASMMSTFTPTTDQQKSLKAIDDELMASPEPPDDSNGLLTMRLHGILAGASDMDIEAQVDRITTKYNTYHSLHFWWWYALIYGVAGFLGWQSSDWLLKLRVSMVNDEAVRDVLQLQTIIAILMNTQLDTLAVIYWMKRSADIHRLVLSDCFNEYPRNPERSIQHMAFQSAIPEFTALCEKLKSTVFDTSLFEAFQDLIQDRASILRMRSIQQEDELKKKRAQASPIAKAPMSVWMVMCFILPIIVVAANSAVTMFKNLSTTLG